NWRRGVVPVRGGILPELQPASSLLPGWFSLVARHHLRLRRDFDAASPSRRQLGLRHSARPGIRGPDSLSYGPALRAASVEPATSLYLGQATGDGCARASRVQALLLADTVLRGACGHLLRGLDTLGLFLE